LTDKKSLFSVLVVSRGKLYKGDMTHVIKKPCENMDKKYVLKQILYYALCCCTGVIDLQYAFNEAKYFWWIEASNLPWRHCRRKRKFSIVYS